MIKAGDQLIPDWISRLAPLLSEFTICSWREDVRSEQVEYIVGWCPDARWVNTFPNLKALVSIGSGVDHIEHLDDLRAGLPVIRTVAPELVQRVREFATLCIMTWHRKFLPILEHNTTRIWHRFTAPTADHVSVGIMGFGAMGRAVADTLSSIGYKISIWAAKERTTVPYEYYWGRRGLESFARNLDAVVCLIPLTKDTRDLLSADFFRLLKRGACVINLARGGIVVEEELIEMVNSGQLSYAYLDGYREEPLPATSRLFGHKQIIITFHSAGYISPEIGARVIADNIAKFNRGEEVGPMYDRTRGF
jgi:glyoxylate/hydroxypyruvate reductase A